VISGSVAALAAAVAAGLYCIYSYHKKRRTYAASTSSSSACGDGDPIPPGAVPKDTREVLAQLFAQAADRIKSLPDGAIAPADRLLAYALYKQATVGDRSSAPGVAAPSKFNVIAHAKYTAWGKFEGMPVETAMIKYIEASHYLMEDAAKSGIISGTGGGPIPVGNDNADIVYTKEDEYRSSDEESDDEEENGLIDVFNSHKNDNAEVKGMGMRQSIMQQQPLAPAPATTSRKRALIAAAMEGDVAKLRDAIDSMLSIADIAEADETGQTALHFAADRGSADCVSLLLDNGADANCTDAEGISALQAAVIGGDVECVRFLLQAGADPDHEDVDGDTPRSCAADDSSEEMKALFSLGFLSSCK